ncbi:MAG: MarR family transcriptional regulator [Proteobacteria bacterium]|nr:MarR family transcriptional regulator [Pseudomonadota bacterium]
MADQTGFLISDVGRLLRRNFDVRARSIGVTRPQWKLLTTLARNEGANQGRLADLIDVEPISLCRMIDRLEESGLVERRTDPADRRAWRIYLTEQAHPILSELRTLADELLDQALDGLSAQDRARLDESLQRIRKNLEAFEDQGSEVANG